MMMKLLARVRVLLIYWWRFGRLPNLSQPTLFTELVQCRKLFDRNPRMPALTDKLAVKAHVAAVLGPAWVTPTLWAGEDLPGVAAWPVPFVVKSRHGCKQIAFIRDAAAQWADTRKRAKRWLGKRYGWWLDEWAYGGVARGLLIEPFVGAHDVLPLDYKFYVFGGRVKYVQVHLDREHSHRWVVLDRAWHPAPETPTIVPLRPACLPEMIAGAEMLGTGFDFVRVDLYQVAGKPRFGEMSFYPGSGLDPFDPPGLDAEMGTAWLEAIADEAAAAEAADNQAAGSTR